MAVLGKIAGAGGPAPPPAPPPPADPFPEPDPPEKETTPKLYVTFTDGTSVVLEKVDRVHFQA